MDATLTGGLVRSSANPGRSGSLTRAFSNEFSTLAHCLSEVWFALVQSRGGLDRPRRQNPEGLVRLCRFALRLNKGKTNLRTFFNP